MRKALPTTVYIKLRTAMNRTTDKVALYNFNLSTFWRKVETIPRTSQIDKRPVSCPEIFTLLPVLVVVVVVVVVNLEARVRFPGPLEVSTVVTGVPEVIPVSSSQVFEPRSLELDAIFLFLFSRQKDLV